MNEPVVDYRPENVLQIRPAKGSDPPPFSAKGELIDTVVLKLPSTIGIMLMAIIVSIIIRFAGNSLFPEQNAKIFALISGLVEFISIRNFRLGLTSFVKGVQDIRYPIIQKLFGIVFFQRLKNPDRESSFRIFERIYRDAVCRIVLLFPLKDLFYIRMPHACRPFVIVQEPFQKVRK